MKKLLINFVKLGISLGLIIYLVSSIKNKDPGLFGRFMEGEKKWSLLALAFVLMTTAVLTSFCRWYFLVRALDLPFRLRDAFRLGFLGYLMNFVSLGSIGGDLFKAVFIAREHPGRRTAAVTSIVFDRVIGLIGLLLMACTAILFVDLSNFPKQIHELAIATVVAAGIGLSVFTLMLFRFGVEGPVADWLCKPGFAGAFFQRVFEAARTYQRRRAVLLLALGMTFVVQFLNILAFSCIAHGLPDAAPSLGVHCFIIPLGLVSAALPLPMEGLGAFETVVTYLYEYTSPDGRGTAKGVLVALGYRLLRITVALIGVGFYLASRREIDHMIHEVEEIEIEAEEAAEEEATGLSAREAGDSQA
ncbi:MAG: lysylphosphatidylglycerol synthase transmembrane domain-containing protein [Pirellulales bacterium]|nr:lysylphosphatidylglycerol synthase transmembrane domain-containing protein [Pirellulales bacterium]